MAEPIFDLIEGDWHVFATDLPSRTHEALVTFEYQDKLYKKVIYPAYAIWNVPAHLREITEVFEAAIALTTAGGDTT